MNGFIVFLHFVGLMIGAAGGFASGVIMRRALTMPAEQAQTIRGLGPVLANVAAIGVAVLCITGLILVCSKWDGLGSLPGLFWVKFIFILTLTAATGAVHWTYAEIRKGNAAAASRLPILGPAAGVSSLLAVLFAVLTFR